MHGTDNECECFKSESGEVPENRLTKSQPSTFNSFLEQTGHLYHWTYGKISMNLGTIQAIEVQIFRNALRP